MTNFRWVYRYHPALGPTQPPVQWVPGLSRGVNSNRDVLLTTQPHSSAVVMEE